jgi:Zn2+/Cd2+-exporting ATPase
MVAFFMLLGEIIETRTAAGARASIESLIKLTPTKARRLERRLRRGGRRQRPRQVGDVIRVRPGDNVPADGVIVTGQGSFNQANITGESLPVDKNPATKSSPAPKTSPACSSPVTRAGQDTTLGRVRSLILAAEKTKLPIMRIVDQYMVYYTPLVLVIGALVWAFTHDLDRVIAVLVVSCPCAFILATPTAMVAALSAAARLGILIKNVGRHRTWPRASTPSSSTRPAPSPPAARRQPPRPLGDTKPAELLRVAASAETYSNHPPPRPSPARPGSRRAPRPTPRDFTETAGRGIRPASTAPRARRPRPVAARSTVCPAPSPPWI